jgi:hypothetical protein
MHIFLFFTPDHRATLLHATANLIKIGNNQEYTCFGLILSKIIMDGLWLCVQAEKPGEISYAVLVDDAKDKIDGAKRCYSTLGNGATTTLIYYSLSRLRRRGQRSEVSLNRGYFTCEKKIRKKRRCC